MGCFKFSGKRKDRLEFRTGRLGSLQFYAYLICSVINDIVNGYFFGADDKALEGADGKFFAGKNQL